MVIFTMTLLFTISVYGIEESQTIHISDTLDDGWVTEIGVLFTSAPVTILDPNQDIRSYLVFREIEINQWEPLGNATLRLRVGSSLPADAGSSVTIYGVDSGDFNGFATAAQVLDAPITSARVDLDTSDFSGSKWVEIDVSGIVNEIKANPTWEGDDAFGGTIGFVIFGAEGNDGRYFIDKGDDTGREAQLVIYWGVAPDPPPPDETPPDFNGSDFVWEFVNSTPGYVEDPEELFNQTEPWSGDIDIFVVTQFADPEIQFMGITNPEDDLWYSNTSKGVGGAYIISTTAFSSESGAIDPILGIDPWTIALMDNGSLNVMVSNDEFLTYTLTDPNNEYNLAPWSGNMGSIALDEQDGETIHLVYTTPTPAHAGVFNVVYTNFTIDQATGALTFAPTYTNLTQVGSTQSFPTLYSQPNGTLHVVYYGKQGTAVEQVYYRRRHANGTWLSQVRVSDTDVGGTRHWYPDVIANDETGVALVIWEFDITDNYWDVVYPNNTDDVDRLMNTGVRPAMVNYRENNTAVAVWASGVGQPSVIYHQTKQIDNSSAWSGNMQVSPGGEKHFSPDVGIDTINNTVATIWYNDWNLWAAWSVWNLGEAPIPAKRQLTTTQIRNNWMEEEFTRAIVGVFYFVVLPNGTVIGGPFDTFDEAEDAVDILLDTNPKDPAPPSQGWEPTGPFTRFRTRLYFLLIGMFMVFGPLVSWAMSRPSGYEFTIGAFIMLIGFALMYAAGQV